METKQHNVSQKSKVESRKSRFSRIQSSVFSLQSSVSSQAFTLIELLVAMGILMIIVLMLANLFQASTRSWDTGMRQAEIGLEARAAINLIQQDLNQAVASTNANQRFTASGSSLSFAMFARNPTNGTAIDRVTYSVSGEGLERNDALLLGSDTLESFTVSVPDVGDVSNSTNLPDLVEISLTMKSSKNFSAARVYVQGRGWDETDNLTDVIDTHRGN